MVEYAVKVQTETTTLVFVQKDIAGETANRDFILVCLDHAKMEGIASTGLLQTAADTNIIVHAWKVRCRYIYSIAFRPNTSFEF